MSFIADAIPLCPDSISDPVPHPDFVSPIALIRERFKPVSDIISTGDFSYPFHLLSIIPPPVYFGLLLAYYLMIFSPYMMNISRA